ncbi:MAG: DUF6096 family protein [bacterium]|nr:DUF6096 family protein [bacterium]
MTVGDKDYKLRIGCAEAVDLEEKLGKHPLNIFSKAQEGGIPRMPKISDLVFCLYYALLHYQPKTELKDVYEIYDKYMDEGHQQSDLILLLMKVFEVSGFVREDKKDSTEKN